MDLHIRADKENDGVDCRLVGKETPVYPSEDVGQGHRRTPFQDMKNIENVTPVGLSKTRKDLLEALNLQTADTKIPRRIKTTKARKSCFAALNIPTTVELSKISQPGASLPKLLEEEPDLLPMQGQFLMPDASPVADNHKVLIVEENMSEIPHVFTSLFAENSGASDPADKLCEEDVVPDVGCELTVPHKNVDTGSPIESGMHAAYQNLQNASGLRDTRKRDLSDLQAHLAHHTYFRSDPVPSEHSTVEECAMSLVSPFCEHTQVWTQDHAIGTPRETLEHDIKVTSTATGLTIMDSPFHSFSCLSTNHVLCSTPHLKESENVEKEPLTDKSISSEELLMEDILRMEGAQEHVSDLTPHLTEQAVEDSTDIAVSQPSENVVKVCPSPSVREPVMNISSIYLKERLGTDSLSLEFQDFPLNCSAGDESALPSTPSICRLLEVDLSEFTARSPESEENAKEAAGNTSPKSDMAMTSMCPAVYSNAEICITGEHEPAEEIHPPQDVSVSFSVTDPILCNSVPKDFSSLKTLPVQMSDDTVAFSPTNMTLEAESASNLSFVLCTSDAGKRKTSIQSVVPASPSMVPVMSSEIAKVSTCVISTECQVVDTSTNTSACQTAEISVNTERSPTHTEQKSVSTETETALGVDSCTNTSVNSRLDISVLTDQHYQTSCDRSMNTSSEGDNIAPVLTLDHSMMAVAASVDKPTMTDRSLAVDVGSSMTPLKLNKKSHRLTAEDVRKQHPRIVANQLDTVMGSNQRLEKELKSVTQDRDKLKKTLKDLREKLSTSESMVEDLNKKYTDDAALLEQKQEEALSELHACIEEKQERILSLEQKLEEAEAFAKTQENNVVESDPCLEMKCEALEKLRLESELHFAEELNGARKNVVSLQVDHDMLIMQNQDLQQDITTLNEILQRNKESLVEMELMYTEVCQELLATQSQVDELDRELTTTTQVIEDLRRNERNLASEREKMIVTQQLMIDVEEKVKQLEEQLDEKNRLLVSQESMLEKMQADHKDTTSKMELYIDNLQHTLDSLELDRDAMDRELDQYCQRVAMDEVKIAELDQELETLRKFQITSQREKNQCEELRNTNQFLEAEKQLYLEAITDYRTRLEATENDQKLLEEYRSTNFRLYDSNTQLQEDMVKMEEKLSSSVQEMELCMAALVNLEEKMESALGKFDHLVTCESMKKKTSFSRNGSKRLERKSFVAQILSKVNSPQTDLCTPSRPIMKHLSSLDNEEKGGALRLKQSNVEFGAVDKQHGAVAAAVLSSHSLSFSFPSNNQKLVDPSKMWTSMCHDRDVSGLNMDLSHSARMPQLPSESMNRTVTSPSRDELNSSVPGFARIRSIPSTVDRTLERVSRAATSGDASDFAANTYSFSEKASFAPDSSTVDKVNYLLRLFGQITKAVDTTQRKSELTIGDQREDLKIIQRRLEFAASDAKNKSDQLEEANARIADLSARVGGMTESILSFQDQSFKITHAEEEKEELERRIKHLVGERDLLDEQLNEIIAKMDRGQAGQKPDGTCLREIISLRKKNNELQMKLVEERQKNQETGARAVRRMKIMDTNWQKAESEVVRFDKLVESIRQICIQSQSQPKNDTLLQVIRLIDGR